jgi:diguanylate cyclase (GGDEF)-like protein
MASAALRVLLIGVEPALAPALGRAGFSVQADGAWSQAGEFDAVLAAGAAAPEASALAQAAFDTALVLLQQPDEIGAEIALLRQGVEAIVPPGDTATIARAIHHAVERKRLEHAARTAYATDLATGLPHQAQLLEHMTQLLALRGREPGPMVLLVLRVEGFEQARAQLGVEAGNVLRRKVAVRLRSLLRASDVVAAIGSDAFGVLLGRLEAKGDGDRVATKLVRALQQPILVAGRACSVGAAVGMAVYPDHGGDAPALLQRACAQAGSVATVGAAGFAGLTRREAGGAAANDETPG